MINFQKLDQIEANLEKKEEKSFKLDSKRSLKMTSIPKNSQDAKTLADMVQSSKSSSIIAGVQVVNGLMLSQFELQASQGNILFIERIILIYFRRGSSEKCNLYKSSTIWNTRRFNSLL